jgi:large subunit ribosomal protein L4
MAVSITVQHPTETDATAADTVNLPDEVFAAQTNVALIHQVVVAQLAAARQGTHDTKTRGEVAGGGKKPYRQKGTGRARQGSIRAPQFAGGGVAHGPTPRGYDQRTPKKMKAAALRGALSDRARNDRVHVVSALVSGDVPSTKAAAEAVRKVTEARNVLVVAERSDELTWKSLRNVASVHLLEPGQLNTYDVLVSDDIVFTEAALAAFLAGPVRGRSVTARASSAEVEPDAAEIEAGPDITSPTDVDASDVDDLPDSDGTVEPDEGSE